MDANCQLNWMPRDIEAAGPIRPVVRGAWDQGKCAGSELVAISWSPSGQHFQCGGYSGIVSNREQDEEGKCTSSPISANRCLVCFIGGGVQDCCVDRLMGAHVKTDHRPLVMRRNEICRTQHRRTQAACIPAWVPDESWHEQVRGVHVDSARNWEGSIKAIHECASENGVKTKQHMRVEHCLCTYN